MLPKLSPKSLITTLHHGGEAQKQNGHGCLMMELNTHQLTWRSNVYNRRIVYGFQN
jgi:hypothetical protein